LNDLNPVPFEVVPFPEPDPTTGGVTNTLGIFGGNPDLKPEKARTWTAGLDFTPHSVPNFRASATYYNIRFTDVIIDPEYRVNIANVLSQQAILGPAILQRNPSPADIQQLVAAPTYVNPFGIDPATIGAIFDSRVHNLSILRTNGLDLDGSWAAQAGDTNVELGLAGTYIFRFESQFTPTAPTVSVLNTAYDPVNLRIRARAIIRRGGLTFASFVNFTNSYRVDETGPTQPVSSWTTVDSTVKYLFDREHGPLADASVLFCATNLLNKAPPYVPNPAFSGINFDGANANALGRFLSIQLSKRW
jgi:outer membrane receptor protein involved in Fe transport